MNECRAAVITALNQPLEIQRVPVPALQKGEMLVKIEAATLCGTDIHRWHGPMMGTDTLPMIVGHEPCGTIEEMAGEKRDIVGRPLKKGDRVVWSYVACGNCYWCTAAVQPCVCPDRMSWGHNRSDQPPYLLGSAAEYMFVPKECHIVKVPETVSSASAAASACAYRTIMHGFDNLGAIKSHETVLIQGSGPLGTFAAAVAKDHGAKSVLMIGAPKNRLEVALRMGVDEALNLEDVKDAKDRRAWVLDRTGGRGADVVIQAAAINVIPEGLTLLRKGGRFLNIGIGGSGKAPIEAASIPMESTIITPLSGEPRHWLQAIDFMASRHDRYPFDDMISKSYKLDEINDAMQAMAKFEVVKAVIYPHAA